MRTMIKPRAVRPGQTLGLVAPSSALPHPERLPAAVDALKARGYAVKVGQSCLARYGNLAGEDALRAQDINQMFRDREVDAILCVRGGYGTTRIVPMLDYEAIGNNPKVFSGYSDVTALHSAIGERTGLVTFHGLMAVSDLAGETVDAFSEAAFWRVVGEAAPAGLLENPPEWPRETLVGGRAQGRLIGGNLSLLAACMGTPYAYGFDGAILFIEEVSEQPYAVDRMLTQLRNAGAFERCAGVVLGEFTNCQSREGEPALPLRQIFLDCIGPAGKPILAGLRCGHCTPKLTLPFGVACALDADARTLTVLESAVV